MKKESDIICQPTKLYSIYIDDFSPFRIINEKLLNIKSLRKITGSMQNIFIFISWFFPSRYMLQQISMNS